MFICPRWKKTTDTKIINNDKRSSIRAGRGGLGVKAVAAKPHDLSF